MFMHKLSEELFTSYPDRAKTQALLDAMSAFDKPEELAMAMHVISGGCMPARDHNVFLKEYINLSCKCESCRMIINGIRDS